MEKSEKIEQLELQGRRVRFGCYLFAAAVVVTVMNVWSDLPWTTAGRYDGLSNIHGETGGGPSSSSSSLSMEKGGGELLPSPNNRNRAAKEVQQEQQQQPQQLQSESELEATVAELDKKVRAIKETGVMMEVDPAGVAASKELQEATRLLLAARYGAKEPYRVRADLIFQESNPTTATMGTTGSFMMELAPSSLVPHSIYTFLEIARHWPEKKGSFHRKAGHVLQVNTRGKQVPHLAFQEYSKEFPHVKGTVGYAGRPSGPAWYVSIRDNSINHGPGSQQKENPYEADSCFGKVVEGFEDVVLKRITKMPGPMGFLNNPKDVVKIDALTILVPNEFGDYVPWKPAS